MTAGSTSGAQRIADAHESLPPPRLAVTIFGGIDISYGQSEVRLTGRKARALLAYLALSETGREPRDRLAGLFWPDNSEQNARASLRQVLLDLREALSSCGCQAVVTGRQDVELVSNEIDLDLTRILRDIAAGRAPEVLLIQPRAGETILFGYDDVSPLFQEWLVATRVRVQERLVRGLEQGYANEALPRRERRLLAEAVLMIDPLHEAACRMVMLLAAEDGEIGSALRAYDNLYKALGDELDMEPSGPTRELVAEIKLGHFDRLETRPGPGDNARMSGSGSDPQRNPGGTALGFRPSIAVLPFLERSAQGGDGFIGDAIAEDIIAALASLPDVLVISRNSTLRYRHAPADIPLIGRELGVRYVCSGTVRRSENRLRVFAELADAETLAIIGTASFEGDTGDLFVLENRLTERILQTIAPHIHRAELLRARSKRTENLDAYESMLRGLDLLYRLSQSEFEQARQLFERSISLDDNYAAPYAFLALWHTLRVTQGWSSEPQADRVKADEFASAALLRDPNDPHALSLSGHVRALLFREFDAAFDLFDRALRATPNSVFAWARSSPAFSYSGNAAEGRRRAEEALRLSPLDPHVFFTYSALALADYVEGDYERAIEWGRRSAAENPIWTGNLRLLTASLAAAGRIAEARHVGNTIRRLEPNFRVRQFCDTYAFGEEARRTLLAAHLLLAGLSE
jgi:DNA-binding SARP family transcriptional activator/TolB-like protein